MSHDLVTRHRDFLRTFAVFKGFHPNELLLLSNHLIEKRFEKGEIIFQEGDFGKSCFFIVFGKVAVLKKLPQKKYEPLATLKGGQLFGQVSMIDDQPRSATCVSIGKSLLLELPKDHFDRMFDLRESFAFRFQDYLTRVMIRQVRQANEKLASLRRKAGETKRPDKDRIDDLFVHMKDAMRSAHEMGVDLDEVDYIIPEGQRRDNGPEQRRKAREQRARVTRSIRQASEALPKSNSDTQTIDLQGFDLPELKDAPRSGK